MLHPNCIDCALTRYRSPDTHESKILTAKYLNSNDHSQICYKKTAESVNTNANLLVNQLSHHLTGM